MSRELDQVLKALSGAVHDRADLQPLGLSQLVAQLEPIGRGRFAGEQVIGDGAQRENIEVLAEVVRHRRWPPAPCRPCVASSTSRSTCDVAEIA